MQKMNISKESSQNGFNKSKNGKKRRRYTDGIPGFVVIADKGTDSRYK